MPEMALVDHLSFPVDTGAAGTAIVTGFLIVAPIEIAATIALIDIGFTVSELIERRHLSPHSRVLF